MKSVLILCFITIVISFTIATVIGVVCASIDIIRSPKRYKITPSADMDIPNDEEVEAEAVEVQEEKNDRRTIS